MKRFFFIILLLTTFFAPAVYAADSSPSADIASKLKEFQKEAASKATQLKELISKKMQNKAFVGTLQSLSGNTLTLSAKSGPKIVSLNDDTIYQNNLKTKQKFSLINLESGDYITALGDVDETGVLTAKKVVLLKALPERKSFFWGQIASVSGKLTTVKDKNFNSSTVKLPDSFKPKLNTYVILTGNLEKNSIFEASFAYMIPEPTIIKPKKIATPSASPKIN